ncbi:MULTISPECIES: YlmC/YmxH family sporulation protein [Bacillaceae]|uniref:YlmC/YmxH family sporulation protein n=1 Tax=Bacillaceae TaxID=186817 RepID=UPI0006AF4821|nr:MULTISPECIES: YlmC/YmxH family sporulation protein [Bacillaceae]ALC85983.1 sporulation protein, YlmC/YmxH family [Bacillus sp. FJAT-22090]KQL35560.1 sporulation protein, YlmC/YmxH family [Psychrobacillus sp. FJAT-21963]MDF2066063.1 YlmC/YmxH family sporulation protein [Bacillus sp. Cr_A10]
MLLSELAEKELIQVKDGARYGRLANTELLFDPTTGKIQGFEVYQKSASFFQGNKANKKKEFISWEEIILIGKDRILFNEADSLNDSSGYYEQ